MKKRSTAMIFMAFIVVGCLGILWFTNESHAEKKLIEDILPEAGTISEMKDSTEDPFVSKNFPGVQKVYAIDQVPSAVITETVGYQGSIKVLSVLDPKSDQLIGIHVISHEDTPEYADHLYADWFIHRFENLPIAKYLNLVVLDKEKEEDIVQVTGATISSQAVVNGVNSAIGTISYLKDGIKMAAVSQVVPQELWDLDENSFAINWPGGSVRLTLEDVKNYPQEEVEATLIKTTGTKSQIQIKGPSLSEVLKAEGVDLKNYEGIGITGRDGYYTMVDKEKLSGPILLGWMFDGEEIRKDEKPIRVCLPEEMGPYWVKLVSNIDLYEQVSPKDIDKVHLFDALTRDIVPYEYEYYGSKDNAIEVGKILKKFDEVDPKGFFTMCAVDGLEKNETISLVRDRYFIKIEGENAPMNIAPNFKLGMNVKNMSHFSTTKDSVVFLEKMEEISRTKEINGKTGLLLEDVMVASGMIWEPVQTFQAIDTQGNQFPLEAKEFENCYLVDNGNQVSLVKNEQVITQDLLTIEKKK